MTKEQAAEKAYPLAKHEYSGEYLQQAFLAGWDACEANRWIRVEDELPTEETLVMVVIDAEIVPTSLYFMLDTLWYRNNGGQRLSAYNKITHWQHLPQPPSHD